MNFNVQNTLFFVYEFQCPTSNHTHGGIGFNYLMLGI
jgi:hypothetical protein